MSSNEPFPNPFDPEARFTFPTPQKWLRPARPEPPRLRLELAWLTWQMPAALRAATVENLLQTLRWRALYCEPLSPPEEAAEYTRFGLLGELLCPEATPTVCDKLLGELREMIRTLEGWQPVLERNWLLAMHSARLGQLCAELEQRFEIDVLEKLRGGLGKLWA
ncbi:MAG TPA: hypothetical protein VFU32_07350 [Ktedonobacterales bacterium]|nr:hypothetical protein [Ktedonobacterales bacterium]